jgi:hypothetical protein
MFQLFLLGSLRYFIERGLRGSPVRNRDVPPVDDRTLSDIGLSRWDVLFAPEPRDR